MPVSDFCFCCFTKINCVCVCDGEREQSSHKTPLYMPQVREGAVKSVSMDSFFKGAAGGQ